MQATVHVNNTSLPAFLFPVGSLMRIRAVCLMCPDCFVRLNTLSKVKVFVSVNLFLYGKFCGTDES